MTRTDRELIDINIEERLHEYRRFAFKDDMLKMSIAFIMGGAFTKAVTAISECLMMPVLNWILKFTGENWRQAKWTVTEGMTFEVGKFAAAFIDFLLISIVLFTLWRILRKLKSPLGPPPERPRREETEEETEEETDDG